MNEKEPINKVRAILTPSETDYILRSLELALASGRRAKNTTKHPDLVPIYAKHVLDLENLLAKIKAFPL